MKIIQGLLFSLLVLVSVVSVLGINPREIRSEEEPSAVEEEGTTDVFYYNRGKNRFERKDPQYHRYRYRIDGMKINVGYEEELYPAKDAWSQSVTRYLYAPPF